MTIDMGGETLELSSKELRALAVKTLDQDGNVSRSFRSPPAPACDVPPGHLVWKVRDDCSEDRWSLQPVIKADLQDVPNFYLPVLQSHLQQHPFDTNFILELAQEKKAGVGGNGFGTITCTSVAARSLV